MGGVAVSAGEFGIEAAVQRRLAELVVRLALLLVGEHLVRGRDLLELFAGSLIAGIDVGVVTARQSAVGAPDLVSGRGALDAEDAIEVSLRHMRRQPWAP